MKENNFDSDIIVAVKKNRHQKIVFLFLFLERDLFLNDIIDRCIDR